MNRMMSHSLLAAAIMAGALNVGPIRGLDDNTSPPNSVKTAPKKSKRSPHQGSREIERRRARIAAGKLKADQA